LDTRTISHEVPRQRAIANGALAHKASLGDGDERRDKEEGEKERESRQVTDKTIAIQEDQDEDIWSTN
jgi:hypothetical protein